MVEKSEGNREGVGMTVSGWAKMELLDKLEVEERDKELDEKMGEGKRRKHGEEEKKEWRQGRSGLPGGRGGARQSG